MPEDQSNNQAPLSARPASSPPTARRRRFVTRRNTIIAAIGLACAVIALLLVGLIAYRLGYVDRYIAAQVKDTLAKYGVRAEIKNFHTSISPQTVEMLGVELYDAQSGEKLGKIDRILVTVRIEDLYALNLRRNINLKDLQIEGLELWVTFDAQGRVNQVRAEIQDLTLRSPIAETHLSGVMGDWRKLQYIVNVTSTVDLTQASEILQPGTTLRGAGSFVGTVNGDGDHYTVDGSIKSDA